MSKVLVFGKELIKELVTKGEAMVAKLDAEKKEEEQVCPHCKENIKKLPDLPEVDQKETREAVVSWLTTPVINYKPGGTRTTMEEVQVFSVLNDMRKFEDESCTKVVLSNSDYAFLREQWDDYGKKETELPGPMGQTTKRKIGWGHINPLAQIYWVAAYQMVMNATDAEENKQDAK